MSMPIVAVVLAFLVVIMIMAVVVIVLALRRRTPASESALMAQRQADPELGASLAQPYPAEPGRQPEPTRTEPESYR